VKFAAIYAVLAVISTVFNIGSQDIVIRLYHGNYAVTLQFLSEQA